jgi:hypothetical protein
MMRLFIFVFFKKINFILFLFNSKKFPISKLQMDELLSIEQTKKSRISSSVFLFRRHHDLDNCTILFGFNVNFYGVCLANLFIYMNLIWFIWYIAVIKIRFLEMIISIKLLSRKYMYAFYLYYYYYRIYKWSI